MVTIDQLEQGAAGARFGRSRALKFMGGAVFGLAFRAAMRSDSADAYHRKIHACGDSGGCHCCSGTSCCESGCTVRNGDCDGNPQHNSWMYCRGGHSHRCADWSDRRGRPCICRGDYERRCGEHPCATGTDYDVYGAATRIASGSRASSPTASAAAFVELCAGGAPPADLIPQEVTDLIVYAEGVVRWTENWVDTTTDPDGITVPSQVCTSLSYPFDWCVSTSPPPIPPITP